MITQLEAFNTVALARKHLQSKSQKKEYFQDSKFYVEPIQKNIRN
jgi:hypothetical protein